MSWTDERVEVLKKLWGEGHSASQIAAQLGGVTRNAVIGKVHRLGLSGRGKNTRPAAARQKAARPARPTPRPTTSSPPTHGALALKFEEDAAPVPVPLAEKQSATVSDLPPNPKKLSIMALTDRVCKWPIGDPTSDEFYFCGHEAVPGIPYCRYHARIAYQPVSDRRRERKVANG